MDEQFYADYFRDIAKRMFGSADRFWLVVDTDGLSDLNSALRNLPLPALILRPFDSDFTTENDNQIDTWAGVFTILHATTATDFANTAAVRQLARQQAKEVLAMMRKDARPKDPQGKGGKLYEKKIHLMPKFTGSDEPIVFNQATGWSYDFEWRVPQTLPMPTW